LGLNTKKRLAKAADQHVQHEHGTISSTPSAYTAKLAEPASCSSHIVQQQLRPQMGEGANRTSRWLLLVLLLVALQVPASAVGTTAQPDVDALVRFMSGFTRVDGTVLATWDVFVDPCAGGWSGVICTCEDLPRALAASCSSNITTSSSNSSSTNSSSDAAGSLRVRGLELGPLTTADGQKLAGTISPAVGSLTELVYLDLSDNMLR
jgi:hypothetical protein